MSLIDAARHRLRTFFRPNAADHDRDAELRFHQDLAAEHLAHEIGDAEDAGYAARRELGNTTYAKEEMRHMGALRWVDATVQDLRFASRIFVRSPVFTAIAVLSIGVGIGANTAIFSVINALMLERLPISNPRELVQLWRADSVGEREPYFSVAEFDALRTVLGTDVTALTYLSTTRAEIGGASYDRLSFDAVDGWFFPLLGLRPEAGRLITPADDRDGALVTVFSFRDATRYFGSAQKAVGQRIKLEGHVFTVVGVTPRRFTGVIVGDAMSFVVPRSAQTYVRNTWNPQDGSELMLVTRLAADSVRTRLGLERAFAGCCGDGQLAMPRWRKSRGQLVMLSDISRGTTVGKFDARAMFSRGLYTMMAGVAMILLMACTNVGNLLLARATVRSRELAVRLSLGASRLRIVRQLLVESALLATLGTVVGVALAVWGTSALAGKLPGGLQMLQPYLRLGPNGAVLGFATGIALLCTIVFGVLPAIRATKLDPIIGLRSGSRTATRSGRLDRGVIAFQMSIALVLVASAGLLGATLRNLSAGLGDLDPDRLLIAEVEVAGTTITPDRARAAYDEIDRQLHDVPGVRAAVATDVMPLVYRGFSTRMLDIAGFEDRRNADVEAGLIHVSPGFFTTTGSGLSAGREFGDADIAGAPEVTIISETIARQFFPGTNPIGQMIGFRGGERSMQIVGVARDVKQSDLRAPAPRTVYLPRAQRAHDGDRLIFAMRINGRADVVALAARAAITAAAPNVVIRTVRPLSNQVAFHVGRERALATVAIVFSALAVGLAAIGLYGVMAFQVTSRTREIGVRMALGAGRARVVRMILGQSLGVAIAGVVVGVPLALAAANALRALLYGVAPFEPAPFVLAVGVLVTVAVVATLVPSRNAARVDPLIAMRAE